MGLNLNATPEMFPSYTVTFRGVMGNFMVH